MYLETIDEDLGAKDFGELMCMYRGPTATALLAHQFGMCIKLGIPLDRWWYAPYQARRWYRVV